MTPRLIVLPLAAVAPEDEAGAVLEPLPVAAAVAAAVEAVAFELLLEPPHAATPIANALALRKMVRALGMWA
jgi:hypothetical protein